MIPEGDAARRLEEVLARVDLRLVLDRGNVRYVSDPYPGVEFGLRLGEAATLLFMPEADLAGPEWETRMFKRIEAARRYLDGFPGSAADRRASPRQARVARGEPR